MATEGEEESDGTVVEDRPSGIYKVELDDGTTVLAHVGPEMRMKFTRIRPGERVRVVKSEYDHSRGRIVNRYV